MAEGRSVSRAGWYVSVLLAIGCTFPAVGCTSDATKASDRTTYTIDNPPSAYVTVADAGDEPEPPPNGPAACPAGVCNYQTQAGCIVIEGGVTPTCIPQLKTDGTVAPACVRAGAVPEGQACSSLDDCEQGHVCAGGICRRLCCGKDWTACPVGQSCTAPFSIAGHSLTVPSGAYVCESAHACDVLTGVSCPASTVCQIVDPVGSTACVSAPAAGAGATPGDVCPPCQTGFMCTGRGCTRLCSVTDAGPSCPLEEGHCVHFRHDPDEIGECTPVD